MASNRSLLSDTSMNRIAERLGVSQIVEREGWGGVSSRDCGGVVAVAVRIAEEALAAGLPPAAPTAAFRQPLTGHLRHPEAGRFTGGDAGGWTGPRP